MKANLIIGILGLILTVASIIAAIYSNDIEKEFPLEKISDSFSSDIWLALPVFALLVLWWFHTYHKTVIEDQLKTERDAWEDIKNKYRENICNKWKDNWPKSYLPPPQLDQSELYEFLINLLEPSDTPYIEDQGLQLLVESDNEKVLQSLDPRAFVSGRNTEQEAVFDIGNWVDRKRRDFLSETTQSLKRIFVISGGGIGKSTLLKWLEFKLNAENTAALAFFLEAHEVNDENTIMESLVNKLCSQQSKKEDTHSWLEKDLVAGHIVLLIDGLDHLQTGIPGWLIKLHDPNSIWKNCPIVLSGRPYVVNASTWSIHPRHIHTKMFVGHWQFWRLKEFNENQQKAYLGKNVSGEFRWDQIPEEARQILSIPRVLEYIRALNSDQLTEIDSVTKVYNFALFSLVKETINKGSLRLRQMGLPDNERHSNINNISDVQRDYVLALLGALAFLMTQDKKQNKWNFESLNINSVLNETAERIYKCSANESNVSKEYIKNDIRVGLAGFSAVVSNGVLESFDSTTEMKQLFWTNKSVQCFFVAYWLARYSSEADAKMFQQWVWSSESKIDDLYEINLFLAEMPQSESHCVSWIRSAAAWFKAEQDLSRPTEMMFRAWPRLLAYAGEEVDNWWDIPYVDVHDYSKRYSCEALSECSNASNEDKEIASNLAKDAINKFRKELTDILTGTNSKQMSVAEEFVHNSSWKQVPEGTFMMGSPKETQGFSEPSLVFWHGILDRIQNGENAKEVSEELNDKQWFTGAQGKRLRNNDVAWLTNIFSILQENTSPNSDSRNIALQEIKENWYREDEIPFENPQKVHPFKMHKLPILQRWFWLFSPNHKIAVEKYLKSIDTDSTGNSGDDHPAIYISWFDAWAFCQWAQWEKEGRTYRCRLPHEPEWEFAAHGKPNAPSDKFLPSYWWEDSYNLGINSSSTQELHLKAHTTGDPGKTRNPLTGEANGLGFHDILGNVWEWMANIYKEKYSRNFPNQVEINDLCINELRTMRGGLWYFHNRLSHCSNRFRLGPDDRDYKMGFRVIREEIPSLTKSINSSNK